MTNVPQLVGCLSVYLCLCLCLCVSVCVCVCGGIWGRGNIKLHQKSSTPPSISLLRGASEGALAIWLSSGFTSSYIICCLDISVWNDTHFFLYILYICLYFLIFFCIFFYFLYFSIFFVFFCCCLYIFFYFFCIFSIFWYIFYIYAVEHSLPCILTGFIYKDIKTRFIPILFH